MIKQDERKSLQQGHRARLRQKFLDDKLTEYEQLELILTYAIPRRDVRELSRHLYNKYGGIFNVLTAPIESLIKNEGVSENTAIFFKILHKLAQTEYKSGFGSAPIFYNQEKLENYCRLLLYGKPTEEFHVFYLDAQHKLIEDQLHSSGTVDWSAVYVREIVKHALDLNARHIVLLHNHPKIEGTFSKQDVEITAYLEDALERLEIKLYDHFLVAGDIVFSMKASQLLNKLREEQKQAKDNSDV